MGVGLEVFDEDGGSYFDINTQACRVLGTFTTWSSTEWTTVATIPSDLGKVWFLHTSSSFSLRSAIFEPEFRCVSSSFNKMIQFRNDSNYLPSNYYNPMYCTYLYGVYV